MSVGLLSYVHALRRQWRIAVGVVAVCVMVAMVTFFLSPAKYTATVSMYVSAQVGDSAQAAYQGAQLSEQRVKSYTEIVTSPRVLEGTIQQLGLSEGVEELASEVGATSSLDSVIIDISVADRSPERAAAIANSVGSIFSGLVDELERPTSPNGIAPVTVKAIQPAQPPTRPSSLTVWETLAIGVLFGAVAGTAIAILRNSLNANVRTLGELRAITHAPNLGEIASQTRPPGGATQLTLQDEPRSARSEAYRKLRTNLQFVDVDKRRQVIAVSSAIPGEGKTTTAVNLAMTLGGAGLRTLLIEGDLRRPNVANLLGLDRAVGLTRILTGRITPDQAIVGWGGGIFDVITSGPLPPNPSELLGSKQMQVLLTDLRTRYDYILVDTPPIIPVTDGTALAPHTDGVLMVCRYDSTSRTQLEKAVESLDVVSASVIGTVFSMTPDVPSDPYAPYLKYESHPVTEGDRTSESPSVKRDSQSERTQRIGWTPGSERSS